MKAVMSKVARALLLLALMIGVGALLWLGIPKNSQRTITFSNGTTLQFVGATYGTTHVAATTPLGRILSRLPAGLLNKLPLNEPALGLNVRSSSKPTLMVWFSHWGPAGPPTGSLSLSSIRAMVRPSDGLISGPVHYLSLINQSSNQPKLDGIYLEDFPQLSRRLEVAFFEEKSEKFEFRGAFEFRNPAPPPLVHSNWIAPSLPTTALAGDLQVTLHTFAAGLGNHTTHQSSGVVHAAANAGDEPRALAQVTFDSPRGTNEVWSIFNADLSSAWGQTRPAQSRSEMTSRLLFSPVLWDEGQPWKLRLHLMRTAGFTSAEQLTFSNVPLPAVGQSNRLDWTNRSAGVTAVLQHFLRRPNLTNSFYSSRDLSEIQVLHPDLGTNRQFNIVRILAHPTGTNLTTQGSSWTDGYHTFQFHSFPEGTTHLDLTFSVQPTRFVEFIVNPNWVTNEVVVPK
jgi:hypothetical protein